MKLLFQIASVSFYWFIFYLLLAFIAGFFVPQDAPWTDVVEAISLLASLGFVFGREFTTMECNCPSCNYQE